VVLTEAEKCVMVCPNCHVEEHLVDAGSMSPVGEKETPREPVPPAFPVTPARAALR
jgi:hypothetical protein